MADTTIDKMKIMSEDIYNKLYPIYEEMIELELNKNGEGEWCQAEIKLKECLELLEKIWIRDREER